MQNWAAIARGSHDIMPPTFIGGSLRPAVNHFPSTWTWKYNRETMTTRRFVFHVLKLASLKSKIEAITAVLPTKVELVTSCYSPAS
ncbi:hypothetical protein TIFTF001_022297 [Ficus carica]|uniref:Uncharacterized protein n=1 Tax=Ficus carica TaxID=3494 RepID=A0AA88ATG7_FICCA|nr:hypothetical protein TIFTF001_022297 [Ficus carica]